MIELRKTRDDDRLCEFDLFVDGVEAGSCHIRRFASHGIGLLPEVANHIGYEVKPEFQRKGHATQMLALALEEAANMGLASVVICADEENIASRRVIEKNGGKLTGTFECAGGWRMCRYAIGLVDNASMQSCSL